VRLAWRMRCERGMVESNWQHKQCKNSSQRAMSSVLVASEVRQVCQGVAF
jgi:hypothetical protein